MAAMIKLPEKRDSLDKLNKVLQVAALIIGLAFTLISGIQNVLKEFLPNKRHEIAVIILCTAVSFAMAATICLFRIRIIRFLGRAMPRLRMRIKMLGSRIHLSRAAYFFIYPLFIGFVLYFIASRTDVWYMIRSRFTEPLIDLTSTSRQHTFQPAISLPWFNYGQDFGYVTQWGWRGVSRNTGDFEDSLRRLRENGVRHVVWFLFCDGRASLKFDSNGYVTGLDPEFLKDYDAAIDIAWKTDMGIVWVLIDYYFMFPKQEKNGTFLFGHADAIEDPKKRESFYEHALKPILSRFRYSPEIAGWILINEPENALKDGYVSPEAVQAFTNESSRIIRANTHKQPVSIASADLESLLEYSNRYSDALDFFVFHHYAPHLPPPVSHIRSFIRGASDKPIYIGEFDINNPPLPISSLVAWSQRLGNAGLWPWNPNASRDIYESFTPPAYEEAKLVSDIIATGKQSIDRAYEEFESRHNSDASSYSNDFRQNMNWWIEYWSATVIPKLNESMSIWQARILSEQKELKKNQEWEADKLKWIGILTSRKAKKQKELTEANESLARNEQARDYDSVAKSKKFVDEVKAELEKVDKDLKSQNEDLETARRRISLHRSLANYYDYKSKWALELYHKFWETEKNLLGMGKGTTVGKQKQNRYP